MRMEEVNINQFVVNKSNALVDGDVKTVGFSPVGVHIDAAHCHCVAKQATDPATGRSRYWLKRCTGGSTQGQLYNPLASAELSDGRGKMEYPELERNDAATGRPRYEFRPVEKPAFDLYVKFLETRNPAFLRNAQRE